jgi:hypothetical protein
MVGNPAGKMLPSTQYSKIASMHAGGSSPHRPTKSSETPLILMPCEEQSQVPVSVLLRMPRVDNAEPLARYLDAVDGFYTYWYQKIFFFFYKIVDTHDTHL